MVITMMCVLLVGVTSAFDYTSPKANITSSLSTNKTIALTSDFAHIKSQFDKGGNYTKKSDFAAFSTDLTDCGKAVIKKYNLSLETGLAFHTFSSPQFIDIMNNGTNNETKKAIINAIDPFFEKISGLDHETIVKTMPTEVINWIKSTAIMMKAVKDNLAKEYAEDRLKAQTAAQNKTNTTIIEDKSKTPNPIIEAPNALDSGIYVKGASGSMGSLNKTEEDKLQLTIKDLQAALTKQNKSLQIQSKDYAARLIAFEKEKLVWKNETRKELDQKKKLFEKIMNEQRAKYENATMISLKDTIREQQKNITDLKANVTTQMTQVKRQQEQRKIAIALELAKQKKLKIELEQQKKEYETELEKSEKEYESELEEVVAKMNNTFFEALKNETMLLEQKKCGAVDDKNETNTNTTVSSCNETIAGWKDKGYRGCQTQTRKGYTCQAWSSQKPQIHGNTPTKKPNAGLKSNFCRNPDGEPTIWCYTTNKNKRWDYCDPIGYKKDKKSQTVAKSKPKKARCPRGWKCSVSNGQKYVSAKNYNIYGRTYYTIRNMNRYKCQTKCNAKKCKSAVFIPSSRVCQLKQTAVTQKPRMYRMRNRVAIWKMPKQKQWTSSQRKAQRAALARKKKAQRKRNKQLKAYWDRLQKQREAQNVKYRSHRAVNKAHKEVISNLNKFKKSLNNAIKKYNSYSDHVHSSDTYHTHTTANAYTPSHYSTYYKVSNNAQKAARYVQSRTRGSYKVPSTRHRYVYKSTYRPSAYKNYYYGYGY